MQLDSELSIMQLRNNSPVQSHSHTLASVAYVGIVLFLSRSTEASLTV